MPGPGLYIVVAVVGVAAGIAFKEFVYDPHLAPKIEQWADAYTAYRTERRRRRTSPQSYSRVDSNDESETRTKDDVELEGLIEREMHTLRPEATLRQRKLSAQESNSLEMLERPNPFLPFVPLSPSSLPPLSPTVSNPENVTMTIQHLPTLQSDRPPSRVLARSTTDAVQSQPQPPIPSYPVASSLTPHDQSGSAIISSMSENGVAVTTSRGTSPFTSASVSRAGTPWSDARSVAMTDLLSEDPSEMSSISDIQRPYLNIDASHLHASQISLSNQSEISVENSEASFDTSFSSSIKTQSDASVDSFESDGEQQADLFEMLSPRSVPGMLSDEEWERVSEAERSARS